MTVSSKTLRTCSKGHKYRKSSDCPTCPICAADEKPGENFLSTLSAPARRALQNAGIETVEQLASWSEQDLLKLHGMGPSSIPKLKVALQAQGLHLSE